MGARRAGPLPGLVIRPVFVLPLREREGFGERARRGPAG
ncbi:hypothetical protein APASM_5730 [Actinosynnema pretiosum subsp. pretiosum]|nr:hypothetical protein APASM_5730 [Actinosynnema pretiosum subsp. pretiosum]